MNNFILTIFLGQFLLWSSADMSEEDVYAHCLDHKGKEVGHGERFFPLGSDPCTQCTCLNGKPQMCIAVFCSPPENCRQYHALSDKCCEFVCLDRDFPSRNGNGTYPDTDSLNTTNLGLRLVASTVTSFLILALLLFMIHRLRQRRLLLMIRRFHARRMDNGNAHLSRRFSEDDDGSVGYFVGHDQLDFSRYDEPPPPYTLWKPPDIYIPPGEAPPPYDLSVQLTAPYSGFSYAPADQVELGRQAIISVHAQNREAANREPEPSAAPNCSICTAADVELNNVSSSNGSSALPPDIQYEQTHESETNIEVVPGTSSADVPTTSGCTCSTVPTTTRAAAKTRTKRNTTACYEENRSTRLNADNCCVIYGEPQENNNVYPDPTVWKGEAESSSSSSPTYEQPSPSSSDSSSTEFAREAASTSIKSAGNFESGCDVEGNPKRDFQRTLSNLKKFSLIRRKKKKRRVGRPTAQEIGCSFVCQPVVEGGLQPTVFEDETDLTAGRVQEAVNPHIGHKLASAGHKGGDRRDRRSSRRRTTTGVIYPDGCCCSSVVTVSGGTIELCNRADSGRHTGISRSGSICSETGERRHHRSAGSSPSVGRCASQVTLVGEGVPHERRIPAWIANSIVFDTRQSSRSAGDLSLDLRDSVLSSGSSWEACSHL